MRTFGDIGPGSKTFPQGHRLLPAEETLARISPLKSSFGITRVANLTGLDRTGIPVVMVCRPNARSSAVFHGKGADIAGAKTSGLMEAIETWHAENVVTPLRFGAFAEISGESATVDVSGLPRLPGGKFDPLTPMLWVEGRDLFEGEAAWLPFEIVHANSTVDGPPSSGCFAGSTNGLASGNHILEATSHAICEIIERDAASLWRVTPRRERDERRLDLDTVDDEACLAILDLFVRAEINVAVWDITSDIGAPTFRCLLVDRTGESSHVGIGDACHPKREVALLRSLTEAAQVRTTYVIGSREDIDPAVYQHRTLHARTLEARALMQPTDQSHRFDSVPDFAFETFEVEVDWLLGQLKSVGVRQAIAVDLTRAEFGIPVMRIVIPGLEGMDHHASYVSGPRACALARRLS
jgi:YcaO-like protein with predicted kinase domain